MRYKIFLFISLFLVISTKTFAAVFVVTNNADSGPGTLREALTLAAANGSSEKDYINFNLPDLSEVGRTITLTTQLPDVSSNLVIDGTTQAGIAFGKSNALVKISTPFEDTSFIVFNGLNVSGVEFYGLYIYDYENVSNFHANLKDRYGINLQHTSDIIIGAANKGNLIKGFDVSSIYINYGSSIKLQGNVLGLTDLNDLSEGVSAGIFFLNSSNISIGGAGPAEGNIVFCGTEIGFAQGVTGNNLIIKSNNFGVFQDGKSTSWSLQTQTFMRIETLGLQYYGPGNDISQEAVISAEIENNTAGNFGNVFGFGAIAGNVKFINNYFGIARDGITSLNSANSRPNEGAAISIGECAAQFNIGGSDISEKNLFAYQQIGIAANDSPNIFVRNNEYQCLTFAAYLNTNMDKTLPDVSITEADLNAAHSVLVGKSSAGAIIDVYSSESCIYAQCSIRKYIETVTADNNGDWKCDIFNLNGLFYVSATLNNRTSEFKTIAVNGKNVIITNLRCSTTATITGLQVPKGLSYYWTDGQRNVVSTDLDLKINKPGKYQLVLGNGCITSDWFEVGDNRVVIYDTGLTITDVSCGNANGSIKNLNVYDPLNKINATEWLDSSGKVIGNTLDVNGLTAGTYYFKALTSDGCERNYGPVILKNTSGPNIDQSNAAIQSTPCGQSTGSITNIVVTGTGTLKYTWLNSQQQTVSNSIDLLNQPAGIYKLQVTDDTQCGPIYSTDIQIPETNGIIIDESTAQTTIAKCGLSNGSITGIKVTGATNYTWAYASNSKIITTGPDLLNMPPGDYVLTASNSFGCIKSSNTYHITQQASTQYPVYDWLMKFACFGQQNGSIIVSTDGTVKSARWVNSQGQTVGNAATLSAVAAGTYQLFLTDDNGCETFYSNYTLASIPQLQITTASVSITHDHCNLKSGSIKNIQVSGGTAPYTYSWADAGQNPIASTLPLLNLGAGVYTLTVNDASGCGAVSATYTVLDQSSVIAPPSVSNLDVCSASEALLLVNNPSAVYKYRLYESNSSPAPIDEQVSGSFKIAVKTNTSLFVSQVTGSCESARAEVKISVGLTSLNIANTFTPNGDGINDYWRIKGVESYPNALVRIFNRYGLQVFESKGYAKPFDGIYNGKQLPAGAYYFIINLNTDCNILSGSLTIVR